MRDTPERDLAVADELGHMADARIAELERERDALREALTELAEKADRASLVQDRSVGLIKQACRYIAKEARVVLEMLKNENLRPTDSKTE